MSMVWIRATIIYLRRFIMAIDPTVKKNWEKIQSKYNFPVDALGRPIDQKDSETLNVWQNEGIDQFLTR